MDENDLKEERDSMINSEDTDENTEPKKITSKKQLWDLIESDDESFASACDSRSEHSSKTIDLENDGLKDDLKNDDLKNGVLKNDDLKYDELKIDSLKTIESKNCSPKTADSIIDDLKTDHPKTNDSKTKPDKKTH
jgi:hypothetical protein